MMAKITKLSVRTQLLLIFLLAIALRLSFLFLFYTDDLSRLNAGDFILYRIGAEHFRNYHDFTNSLFLPRPPLFSLLLYSVGTNNFAALGANAFFGALTAVSAYLLARLLQLTTTESLLVGFIVAIDPATIVYSTYPGPESLANFFMLLAVLLVIWGVFHAKGLKLAYLAAFIAAIALFLSSWARPAAYLLWLPLSVWLIVLAHRRWYVLALFSIFSLLFAQVWVTHNGRVFGNYTFSTVGTYTQVYCRAASVEHFATRKTMDQVYLDINKRIASLANWTETEVTADSRYNFYAASPKLEQAMRTVSSEIFTQYPLWYIATIPIGLGRMYGFTSLLPTPTRPLEIIWHLFFYLGAAIGTWIALRKHNWLMLGGILVVIIYYTVGTLSVSNACMDTRMRSELTPFLALGFVYGLQYLATWYKTKHSSA